MRYDQARFCGHGLSTDFTLSQSLIESLKKWISEVSAFFQTLLQWFIQCAVNTQAVATKLGLVISHSFLNGLAWSFFSCDRGIKGYPLITQNLWKPAGQPVLFPKQFPHYINFILPTLVTVVGLFGHLGHLFFLCFSSSFSPLFGISAFISFFGCFDTRTGVCTRLVTACLGRHQIKARHVFDPRRHRSRPFHLNPDAL